MQNSSFNFASVFAIMVLLVFSYITFLGLTYWQKGNLLLPIILTVALIAIVATCVLFMCKAKATRWKRLGVIGQTFFGLIILIVFALASIPFTNFMDVINNSEEIQGKISNTCEAAESLDKAYAEYVKARIDTYKVTLTTISMSKNTQPTRYNEYLGGAAGNTDDEKIGNLAKSLRSKLLPDATEKIVNERHKWLASAKNTSVWNPLAPSNISKIDKQVDDWVDNYKKLSSVTYKGEEPNEFEYSEFNNQLSELTKVYSQFNTPSALAIIVSLVCFAIMLLPYFMTEKSLASATSKNDDDKYYE